MLFGGTAPYLGAELKRSQKTGKEYCVIRLIEQNGKIFEAVSTVPEVLQQVKGGKIPQFSQVCYEVEVTTGRFSRIEIVKFGALK